MIDLLGAIGERFPMRSIALMHAEDHLPWGRRALHGAPKMSTCTQNPQYLVLDGQQRLTALYKACFAEAPAEIMSDRTPQYVKFFFDTEAALRPDRDLKESIVAVATHVDGQPVDRSKSFHVDPLYQYEHGIFPTSSIFSFDVYDEGHRRFWNGQARSARRDDAEQRLRAFRSAIVLSFEACSVTTQITKRGADPREIVRLYERLNLGGAGYVSADAIRRSLTRLAS